jgi:hypothetical protein
MFIPVGTYTQAIWQVEKDANGKVTKKELMGVTVSVHYPDAFDLIEFDDWFSFHCDHHVFVFFIPLDY